MEETDPISIKEATETPAGPWHPRDVTTRRCANQRRSDARSWIRSTRRRRRGLRVRRHGPTAPGRAPTTVRYSA